VRRRTARGGVTHGFAAILLASCIHYTEIPQASEPPAVSAAAPVSIVTHRVEPGETVWRIAHRYGLPVDVLIEANQIEDVKKLQVGQLVTIPVPPGGTAELFLASRESPDLRAVAAPVSAADPGLDSVDEMLVVGEGHLRAAEVDEALEMAIRALRLLEEASEAPGVGTRIARAEVLAATVHIAHERRDSAIRSLRHALRADQHLELDSGTTAPKLLRAFEEARSELD